jgi:hypothetical protein
MVRKSIQAVIIVLLFITGCKKEGGNDPVLPPSSDERKVYIICEGSMGNGNSTLGLYLPEKDSVYEDVYKAANNRSLGDVFQSMTRIGDQYFLCINNSDQIVVINKNTWKLEGSISVPKPRYILPVSKTKAYVSSLFTDKLYFINPETKSNYASVSLPYSNAEGMLQVGNTAYVAPWDTASSEVLTFNTDNDQPGNRIQLPGRAPQDILLDKEQKLWILAGNVYKGKPATLTRYDPVSATILQQYSFPAGADPIRPVFNKTKDTLYFIEVNYNGGTANNGVYRMGIRDAAIPAQPFLQAQQYQYFWALGIDPVSGYIYVGDPKGFTQRGQVYIYRPDGAPVADFRVGVGPGHFLFDQ